MKVYVNAQFHLKGEPKEYLGITSCNWTFGKVVTIDPSTIIAGIAIELFQFAYAVGLLSVEQVNDQLKVCGNYIANLSGKFVEDKDLRKDNYKE